MIAVENINKVYRQLNTDLSVLKGVSFDIHEGEFVSVVGPSGAGKSTLLHIMGGLDRPTEGHVILDDDDVYLLNDRQRARMRNQKIGFVFQFYHLLPEFTAIENVILPLLIRKGGSAKDYYAEGDELLKRVGLAERVQHKPYQLSGGEQQRVAIARALVNDPKIIFCDEPTGNLDSESGGGVVSLLADLNKKDKKTVVIITHDDKIASLTNRVLHMRDGQLI